MAPLMQILVVGLKACLFTIHEGSLPPSSSNTEAQNFSEALIGRTHNMGCVPMSATLKDSDEMGETKNNANSFHR